MLQGLQALEGLEIALKQPSKQQNLVVDTAFFVKKRRKTARINNYSGGIPSPSRLTRLGGTNLTKILLF